MEREPARTNVRACHISSVGLNIRAFFQGQFEYLLRHSFDYTVITSEPTREGLGLPDDVEYLSIPITRSVTPIKDLISLVRLWRLFRRRRFDLVQYTTPKGALLGSIAAFLARMPIRLYLMWGIYYMGQSGIKRLVFKLFDWIAARLSTHVAFDGFDIREFAISEGLCTKEDSAVVGYGGDNGIDLDVFEPSLYAAKGKEVRQQWGIPADPLVIGFVGRLVGDRGVNELVAAFDRVAAKHPNAWLMLVGPPEERDAPSRQTMDAIARNRRVVTTGVQMGILPYYAAMDIFSLPSYREGFSAVNLEAAAMGLPVVTTDAVGAKESIEDGQTGFAVPVKDADKLAEALDKLLGDAGLRLSMGTAGRRRVAEKFERRQFWEHVRKHREGLLIAAGRFERKDGRLVRIR